MHLCNEILCGYSTKVLCHEKGIKNIVNADHFDQH